MVKSNGNNVKLPSLPLFTDTFQAETIHLSNEEVGIYIRLICFAWTKNSKPFTLQDAHRICQCAYSKECRIQVKNILKEFFKYDLTTKTFTHKRIIQEFNYLTSMYNKRSLAGKKGVIAKQMAVQDDNFAVSKTEAPIPIPKPIPNKIIDIHFEEFWKNLIIKRGSKFLARKTFEKKFKPIINEDFGVKDLYDKYNKYASYIQSKEFICHVSTWLSQERYNDEEEVKKQIKPVFVLPNGKSFKYTGNKDGLWDQIEVDGELWYKHAFKNNEPLKKKI